jgi:hypothetical protein
MRKVRIGKRFLGKKGLVGWMVSIFWVFLTIFVIIGLWAINSAIQQKTKSAIELSGNTALSLYSAEEDMQRTLLYVDATAKIAAEKALSDTIQTKVLQKSACGMLDSATPIWKSDTMDCFPEKNQIRKVFQDSLNTYMSPYLRLYPEANLPTNNYDVMLDKNLDVYGIARNKAIVKLHNEKGEDVGKYAFYPSFTIHVDFDLGGFFDIEKTKALAAQKMWEDCMKDGSRVSTDVDDTETCAKTSSDLVSAKYDPARENYVLLFAFQNTGPRGSTVSTRFASLEKDTFSPPQFLSTDLHAEEKNGKTILSWPSNKASDTKKYEIYSSDHNFNSIAETSLFATTPSLNTELSGVHGEIYFGVVAVDERGNKNSDVKTIKVSIN